MAKKFADDILDNPQKVLDAVRGGEIAPDAKEKGIPILSAAISNNDLVLAAELIERGADVNAYAGRPAAERGMAPIHFATTPEAVALLAEAKAQIDAPYKSVDHAWGMRGETALHSAAINGNLKMAEALKLAGANAELPFSKAEFEYPADSHVAAGDRVLRGTKTINERLRNAEIVQDPTKSPDYLDPVALQAVAIKRSQEKQAVLNELNNKIEFVAGPEKKVSAAANSWASKAKVKEAAHETPATVNDNSLQSDEIFKPSAKQAELALPESVTKYYLQVGKKFYQPNNKELVAFEDKGSELHTKSDSPNIAKSLVAIAQARGWDEIKSTGSESFRRAVWMEAAKLGIHDRGYKPSEVELAELAKTVPRNKVEKAAGNEQFRGGENALPTTSTGKADVLKPLQQEGAREKAQSQISTSDAPGVALRPSMEATKAEAPKSGLDAATERHARQDQAVQEAMAKSAERRAMREAESPKSETLVAHGAAPYMHDKDNSDSYFVTTQDQDGKEKTRWGVDLQRAVTESGASIGDRITLAKAPDKDVEVEANVRDEKGKVIGKETVEATRNKWNVEVAEALRNNSIEQVVKAYPEMAGAAAVLAASEKHAAALNPDERNKVMNMVRENMAKGIEKGIIPKADIREEKQLQKTRTKDHQQQQNQEQERSM